MTETIPTDTAIEPKRLLNEGRVDTERLTLTHENGDTTETTVRPTPSAERSSGSPTRTIDSSW